MVVILLMIILLGWMNWVSGEMQNKVYDYIY